MNETTNPLEVIADPVPLDYRRAVITQVYHAREALWLAEAQATESEAPKSGFALLSAETALSCLQAAKALLPETDPGPAGLRMRILLSRGIYATEAARGHIQRYGSLAASCETKLEQDQLKKLRPIWARSAEEAKKDVHRVLFFLCERFPEAYGREEESA